MHEIRTLLRLAARRLETSAFLDHAHAIAVIAASIGLLLMIADRVGASAFVPWTWVAPSLLVLAAVVATLRWIGRRRSESQVAGVLDDRLDLRDKLSTALHCEGRSDAFAQAAVADAVAVARDPKTREFTRRRLAVAAPGGWWISPMVVVVALLVSLLDPLDIFGSEDEAEEQAEVINARAEIEENIEIVMKEISKSDALKAELEADLGELTDEGLDPDAPRAPEEVKRDAIKKASELNKRLNDILTGEKAQTAEAMREALKQMNTPESGDAKEFADALSKGDFNAAQKALQNLMDKVNKGDMTPEEKEALAKALEDMAKQLEQIAQQQKQLEDALKKAGLDPQLAQNPQALQQAIKNSQNLNQQQKQQLQQMMQAQQAASKMCQGLGQACKQMAAGMGQGTNGKQGQGQMGQGQMASQLSELEQMQMMLQQAQAAANQCQGMCQGLGMGMNQGNAQGMGNRGQGRGGKAPNAPTPWKTTIRKADVHTDPEGAIIARMLVDGPEHVGESKVELKQITAELTENWDEAQLEEQVPRPYQEAHKHYFGELTKLTEAQRVAGEAADGDTGADDAAESAESTGDGG
jgi:hypothetical protein